MNTMKSLRESLKTHVWNVISPWLWRIFAVTFVLIILTMFSDIMMWFGGKTDILLVGDILQFALFLILTQIIFIITMHNVYIPVSLKQNSNTPGQKKEVSLKLMIMACGVLVFMSIIFIWIMFSEYMLQLVSSWLGTKCDRAETLSSIGYGMGGVLAVIGAIAIYRRADADVENNELIEKGNDDYRFQHMVSNLGHDRTSVRVATYYRFYYLAFKEKLNREKNKKEKSRMLEEDIFEMLCSCLRAMTSGTPYDKKDKHEYQIESKTLFDILFKDKFKSKENGLISDNITVDLQQIHLDNMDLSDSNLSGANLSGANLSGANLSNANLSGANLLNTVLSNAKLFRTNLLNARLLGANLSNAHLWHTNFSRAHLSRADLSNAHLSGANLSNARLLHANLSNAYLSRANLSRAYFVNADFSNARILNVDLSGADLSNADLSNTNLLNTNLSNANLWIADLSDANLWYADLSSANLQGAQLKNANLMEVRSIEKADFREARIGDRTITKNDIPEDKGEYYADWNPPLDEQDN